jgi:DNA-binding response OmpR family regulator
MNSRKILYIEDEVYLASVVKETLIRKGYEVLHKKDGLRIMEWIRDFNPDICLLDVMLPHVEGFTLANHIRNLYPRLPVIFITARSQPEDIVKGFSSGGTDYLRKPFSMEELVARIENQLMIMKNDMAAVPELPEEVLLHQARFFPGRFELQGTDGTVTRLSNKETQILSIMCHYRNKVLDRRLLLQAVWGDDSFFNSRILDVYIGRIRKYISAEPGIEIITLKGQGYQFVVQ